MIIALIFTFLYLYTWVRFHQYQFLERDYSIVATHREYSKEWHWWKGAQQAVFFFMMSFCTNIHVVLTCVTFYWIMFDGLFNKMVIKQKFFYIGTSAKTDKTFQTISASINKATKNKFTKIVTPINLSAFAKISLFIILIILFL